MTEVGLFIPCYVDQFYPQVGPATVTLLAARLRFEEPGFGLFISGPSKTADIELALVIGAHGARSTMVFLVG